MTEARIVELAAIMPRQGAPRRLDMVAANVPNFLTREFDATFYDSAFAVNNPRFQFLFATACFHSGCLLPGKVTERWIKRAYQAFMGNGKKDLLMDQVFRLFLQNGHALGHRVNALIIGGASREVIADLCDKSVEVIEAYENIFFDLRDRLSNPVFISSIVFSDMHFYDSACGSNMQRLLQISYERGWQDALEFMGIKNPKLSDKSTAELVNDYVRNSQLHARKLSMDPHAIAPAFYAGQTKTWVGAEAAGKAAGVGPQNTMTMALMSGDRCVHDIDIQTSAGLKRALAIKIETAKS